MLIKVSLTCRLKAMGLHSRYGVRFAKLVKTGHTPLTAAAFQFMDEQVSHFVQNARIEALVAFEPELEHGCHARWE